MMNKEIFGVFGGINDFETFRSESEFDSIIKTDDITVGIRDPGLNVPGRSASYSDDHGSCVIWGEAYLPDGVHSNPARWLLESYIESGKSAIGGLNGSFLATIEHDGDAIVLTDPVRSWECFYTDRDGVRVFGSDGGNVAKVIGEKTENTDSILEFLHLGVVLGNKTLFEDLHRVPFDGYMTADEVGVSVGSFTTLETGIT